MLMASGTPLALRKPTRSRAPRAELGLGDFAPTSDTFSAYRRLRICHLGKYYPPAPGGIEAHVQTIARAQAELGADVRVICINHLNHAGRDVTYHRYGVTETHEDLDRNVQVTRLGRSGCFARLDMVPGLPRTLSRLVGKIDVLHLHTPNPTMVAALAALRLSIPTVVTHHSDVIRQRVLRYAYAPLERLVYRRAAMVLATTRAYAEGSDVLRSHAEKVQLLPLGINLDPFMNPSPAAQEHARRLKQQHGQVLWLAVGRCVYYKGLHTAIAALRHVPGKLLIIGHGPLEKPLREQAERMHVADRVIWCGHATNDELIGAYHAATALWFPSTHKSEAYGLVQVEAMACGCPVINTNVEDSGVTWVSRHDLCGLTVPVNSSTALGEAAMRLLNEQGLRRRLSQSARRRAAHEFNDQTMGVRSLNAYQHVVDVHQQFGLGRQAAKRLHHRVSTIPEASRNQHVTLAF